jgi:hypothetical protein
MEKDALLRSIAVAVCNYLLVAFVSCTLLVNDMIINNNMSGRYLVAVQDNGVLGCFGGGSFQHCEE